MEPTSLVALVNVTNSTVTTQATNSQQNLPVIISTFSTIGFAITLAVPTLSASAVDLLRDRSSAGALLLNPGYRLIDSFSRARWIGFFYGLALLYILPGLLVLTSSLGYGNLQLSTYLTLAAIILTFAGILGLLLRCTIFLPEEVKKTIEYFEAAKKAKITTARPRRTYPCKICAAEGLKLRCDSRTDLAQHISRAHPDSVSTITRTD